MFSINIDKNKSALKMNIPKDEQKVIYIFSDEESIEVFEIKFKLLICFVLYLFLIVSHFIYYNNLI